jgi:hypothetical protein
MQTKKSLLAILLLFTIFLQPVLADKRTENIDIILAIDKSLSMADEQKIESVKQYAQTWLLDQVLIPGDYLVIIAFYGKADVIVAQQVSTDADVQKIKRIISQIGANGRFTDIGNSLDTMKNQFESLANDGRKKFVLMMTDGKQEAPPASKYFSPDGTFNHEFLANTKTIQQTGWKVEILGIGTDTEVKELAQQLSGTFSEIPGTITPETLQASTENLLGTVSLVDGVKVAPVSAGGQSRLSLALKSEGYSHEVFINLGSIQAKLPSGSTIQLLPSPFKITVSASGTTTAAVPVRFPADLEPGEMSASLSFSFLAGERFDPSEVEISFSVLGLVQSYWWLGLIALAVLAALVVAAVLIVRRLTTAKPRRFLVLVDGEPAANTPFGLASKGEIYFSELDDGFGMAAKRNARSLARFRFKEGVLGFDILKTDRFPKITGSVEAVIGKTVVVRTANGTNSQLTVKEPPAGKPPAPKTSEPKSAGPQKAAVKSPVSDPKTQPSARTTIRKAPPARKAAPKRAARRRGR